MINPFRPIARLSRIMPFLLFALLQTLSAAAVAEGNSTRQYNIPPQPLASALQAFSDSSHLQLLYDANLVAGMTSPAVKGAYTPQQALAQLLGQSGLSYQIKRARMVTLTKRTGKDSGVNADENLLPVVQVTAKADDNAGGDATLPKVTVEADADNPYDDPTWQTDPYNTDYVLPKATAGTKTNTPVMETPLNVQVISKQVLKDQQVITLGDALKNVSGVTTTSPSAGNDGFGGASQRITLRGFQSETFFRNGFRLQQGAASREMANVESVEVLKGSAAILYGLVEPGGMVNVVTKQPLATPYYALNQQFGSYNLYRTTLDATGPIANNKDVLYRVNMSYQNSGSFRDFVGKEDVFFAPVLKWNISPRTQATFELEYNRSHNGLDFGFVPTSPNGTSLLSIPINRNFGAYSPATTETIFGGFNWSHQFNDDWAVKHRFSVNQMGTSIPRLVSPQFVFDGDIWNQLFPPGPGAQPAPSGQQILRGLNGVQSQFNTYSTNLDLVGHFDTGILKHTLLFGGDYYRMNFKNIINYPNTPFQNSWVGLNNPVNPGIPAGVFTTPGDNLIQSQTDQYGLYAQDQIKLPYGIHVTGGLRYQYIHQSNINGIAGSPDTTTALSQDAVTPRVGILWQPQNWVSLYANYVESFGANNAGALVFPGKPLAPTSSTQYEGGIKVQFFDGRLRATLAYFDLTKTNIPSADPNPRHICGSGGIGSCSVALGEVRSRGPELDIQGEILPGWNAIATWSNTDIIVTKTNGTSDISSDGVGGASGLKPGDRMPYVPRNTASFWTTYEVQESALKGLKFGGGVTVQDEQSTSGGFGFSGPPPARFVNLSGFTTVGLIAAYSRDIGKAKVTVQFNVDNLLDEKYFTTALRTQIDPTVGSNGAGVSFGTPRTFMGQVSIQY